MDPRESSDVQATGTLPLSGQSSVPVQPPAAVERERPAWLQEARDGLTQPGKYLAYEEFGRQHRDPAQPGVDPDRALAGRRRPLRRRDGVAPSCARRQPGRGRTRARRPVAERRLRQRRARRVGAADRRRRDHDRAPQPSSSSTPRRSARPPRRSAAGSGVACDETCSSAAPSALSCARHGRDDRRPVAEGRHGQDHHGAHAGGRLPPHRAGRARHRPRPAGQPVGLLRRRPRRRADDRRRARRPGQGEGRRRTTA